jgi:hypothetical protein
MKAWTIKQLKDKMIENLNACHSDFERSMVKAIGGKEIREKAIEFSKARKLTPCEIAIASEFGYKA